MCRPDFYGHFEVKVCDARIRHPSEQRTSEREIFDRAFPLDGHPPCINTRCLGAPPAFVPTPGSVIKVLLPVCLLGERGNAARGEMMALFSSLSSYILDLLLLVTTT